MAEHQEAIAGGGVGGAGVEAVRVVERLHQRGAAARARRRRRRRRTAARDAAPVAVGVPEEAADHRRRDLRQRRSRQFLKAKGMDALSTAAYAERRGRQRTEEDIRDITICCAIDRISS